MLRFLKSLGIASFGTALIWSFSLAQPSENIGSVSSPIIAGTPVDKNGMRYFGLVTLSVGCSGVLITDRWVLTAGHCFTLSSRPFSTSLTSADASTSSDLVYVFGGETDSRGNVGTRGYDLALVRAAKPLTTTHFTQKQMLIGPPYLRAGAILSFFGQGFSTYFQPGPPPVPPGGFGSWRTANLKISEPVSHLSRNADHRGWPPLLPAASNLAGQVCAPGDSGGPVFFTDSATGVQWLAAIEVTASFTCPNQASITVSQCKATITNVTSCNANMIPAHAVEDITKTSWNPAAASQTMDVGEEIVNYLFDDPSPDSNLDMNVRGWAATARAANEMCYNRGFVSGHMNGHQLPGKYGLVCSTKGAVWRDAIVAEVLATQWQFSEINDVNWAQARRAATDICGKNGFVGGHFNGQQARNTFGAPSAYGLVCYRAPAEWFDATTAEIDATHWTLGDLNTVPWAQAARAATEFCKTKRFDAGFMTGHQVPGKYGVVCQRIDQKVVAVPGRTDKIKRTRFVH